MPDLGHSLKNKGRGFQAMWYTKKKWLCASESWKKLFCWPCLLFCPGSSTTWTKNGYNNMQGFLCDCKKHEKAKSHMDAFKTWQTFTQTERVDVMLSHARREEIRRHNEQVRQNRDILKLLTDAVLYLSKQELPFREHDESTNSLNKGNYRELLECFGKFDSVFERRLHGRLADSERGAPGCFTGVSSDIQNDLIVCIDSIIEDQIVQEIKNCTFLSIQIDEATDVSTKEQLSIIIRLDSNGDIVERLLRFVDVSADRTAASISRVVKSILEPHSDIINNKLIMQTYDGASVMSGHLNGVQALIRQEYPFAYFVHCAAHRLNLVLCQAVSSISPVKIFFTNVGAFSSFTSVSSKRKAYFTSHKIEIPSPGDTRWHYRSRTISVLFKNYQLLIDVLEKLVDQPTGWDDATLNQASGLLQYLNSFLFCFLVCLFHDILEQSAILFAILHDRETDFSYGIQKIENLQTYLSNMRNDGKYDTCYQDAVNLVGPPVSRSDTKHNYRQLYYQVIDTIYKRNAD